jgi:tetratricopeptide (TPR) repeat protein
VILSDSPFKSLRRDLCLHGLAHDIALEPLSASEIERYIGSAFSPNQLTGLESVLHRHSGGNPLFMAATLDHLVTRGVIEWDGSCWRMTMPLEQMEPDVPETLRHLLDLQLEQLTSDESRVLMCATVAGERFSSWEVATMLGDERMKSDDVCIALVERGQFLRTAVGAERAGELRTTYEFTHALYRDALYRRLPTSSRITYHRRLAHGLERLRTADHDDVAGTVAAHYEAAGVYDRAVTNTIVAAGNALRRYAHAEALALLTHARELNQQTSDPETGAREFELLQRRGDVEYARGEMALAADAYDEAAAAAVRADVPAAAAQVLIRAARSAAFFDVPRALDACDRAAQVAIDGGLTPLEARATLVRLCWTLLHRGWSRELADTATAALETLVQSNADLTPADHILFANVQVFRAEYGDATARADAALSRLDPTDSVWEHLGALAAKGGALALRGRLGEAYRTLTTAIEIARKNENAPWLDILTGLFGSLHFEACDFAGAAQIASSRLPASSVDCVAPSQMHLLVVSGAAELGLGHVDRARVRFSAVRAFPRQDLPIVHWYWRVQAQLGLVETMLAAGDVATARAEITDVTAAVANLDEVLVRARAWESRARVELMDDAIDSAEASIGQALECLARHDVPSAAWRVHATAAAILRRTDPSLAASHAERARAILTRMAESLDDHPRLRQSLVDMPATRALLHGDSTIAAAPDARRRRSRQLS